jgi:hypothetical protein
MPKKMLYATPETRKPQDLLLTQNLARTAPRPWQHLVPALGRAQTVWDSCPKQVLAYSY